MRFFSAFLLLCVIVEACGSEQAGLEGISSLEEPVVRMLPKWKLPGDYRVLGKADQYDDYRAAHPQWYALTVEPQVSGFRTATEWQEMAGVLLAFPGSMGSAVNSSMAQMVVNGADYVDWYIVVPNSTTKNYFVNLLKGLGMSQAKIDLKVHFITAELDSIWMIDFGPFPLVAEDGSVAFADFRYYHERVFDDAIPTKLGNYFGVTTYRAGLDYEGGNFQMDEVGTCYHSQGLYWENADKTQAEIHDILSRYLGCKTFVVLAPLQDGTTHIDMFSKLVGKNVFVLGKATSSTATQQTIQTLEQDYQILTAAVLADGTKLNVYRIPMPYQKDGVWRTYTNSTLANGVNLWPIYSVSKDLEAQALSVWQTVLPDWHHIGINSDTIITWGGAMHCISRAIPAGTYTKWVPDGKCVGGVCQGVGGGYDGSCTSDAACVGPKWICALPECGPSDCGDITWEGCCDGEVLKYCENNKLVVSDCSSDPKCGWNAVQQYYDCGTNGGTDPSGKFPKACPGSCTPNCTGKQCGDDGCGGSCGSCPAGQACANGQCVACTPNCTGKQCGDDGCGGSCGDCPAGYVCEQYQCVQQTDPCKGITIEGCCDGNVNWWCEDGQLFSEDCSKTNPPSECGWLEPGYPYVSGYYCGGKGEDPSGKFPKECPGTCVPNCAGKQCGDDGCGGSCGACPAGQTCDSGKCVGCVPNCAGKQCGDDGCGGSCGSCPGGQWCEDGKCEGCVPDCSGKECGNDGCGGSCGTCGEGETCQGGQCVLVVPDVSAPDSGPSDTGCVPMCAGRECGPDGCGGFCGACSVGFICDQGRCVAVGGDDILPSDTGGDEASGTGGGKSGGGCTTTSRGAQLPILALLLGLLALRKRKGLA